MEFHEQFKYYGNNDQFRSIACFKKTQGKITFYSKKLDFQYNDDVEVGASEIRFL